MISHKPPLTSHDFAIIKLEETVKTICRNLKFSFVSETCVTKLAAVLRSKIEMIAQDTRMMMENSGRTQPAVSDVLAAFKIRRFSVDQLVEYAEKLKNEQLAPLPIFPVPDHPATDENYFQGMYGPKPSDLELQHRPEHIPSYYRAMYPELLKPKIITPAPKIHPKTRQVPIAPVSPPSSFFPNFEDMDYESLGFVDERSPEPEPELSILVPEPVAEQHAEHLAQELSFDASGFSMMSTPEPVRHMVTPITEPTYELKAPETPMSEKAKRGRPKKHPEGYKKRIAPKKPEAVAPPRPPSAKMAPTQEQVFHHGSIPQQEPTIAPMLTDPSPAKTGHYANSGSDHKKHKKHMPIIASMLTHPEPAKSGAYAESSSEHKEHMPTMAPMLTDPSPAKSGQHAESSSEHKKHKKHIPIIASMLTHPEPPKTGQYAESSSEHKKHKKDMTPEEYKEYKRQKKERRRQKKEEQQKKAEPVIQKPEEPVAEPPVEKPRLKIRIKIDPALLPPTPPVVVPKLAEPESSTTASPIEPPPAPLKIRFKMSNISKPDEPKVAPISLSSEPLSTSEKAHKEHKKDQKKAKRGRPKKDLGLEPTVTQGAPKEGTVDEKIYICPVCSVVYNEGAAVIGCDRCQEWFHWACVGITTEPPADSSWFCKKCSKKIRKEKRRSEHHDSESAAKRQKI